MPGRLAALGLGVVLGAIVWPWLEPDPLQLCLGLLGICALCLRAPSARTAMAAWTAGAILLGALSTAMQPGPIPLGQQTRLVAKVLQRQGAWVRVRTDSGQARVRLGPSAPPVGSVVALWTRPASPATHLPGARSTARNDSRRRLVHLTVRDWELLGPEPTPSVGHWQTVAHGGLLRALATGNRDMVTQSDHALLKQTGTVHLMAISGLHVGLICLCVAGLMTLLSRPLVLVGWPWVNRWLALLAAVMTALAYGGAVGWPASAQRAGWVVAIALLARATGRPARAWDFLGLAAAAVVIWDPGQVGELGFQLSFGAVIGILLWAPQVIALGGAKPSWAARWLLTGVGTTIGAIIGTLPVLAWDFQSVAPIGVAANLIATPLIGTISVPAALIAAHGPTWIAVPSLGLGNTATGFALFLLEHLAVDPLTPAVGPAAALGLSVAVLLARKPIWAAGLMMTCLLPSAPPSDLVVTFPAVGQGSAALVEWPDGRRWLIDGGPPSTRLLRWIRRRGIRRLDKVILSHAHPDHMGGLRPIVHALEVGQLWAPERPEPGSGRLFELWRDASQLGVTLRVAGDDGLAIMHPPADWEPRARSRINERSIVLRITHGEHSFLFSGDIEAEAEARLLPQLSQTTVVHVPHHGSRTSSSQDFVDATKPRWAVMSLGSGNRFGHPAPEVLARWGPARSLRTDTEGTLRFTTDGTELQVSRWQPEDGWQAVDRQALSPPTSSY